MALKQVLTKLIYAMTRTKNILCVTLQVSVCSVLMFSCTNKKSSAAFRSELDSLNLLEGEISLCGSDAADQFGKVSFALSCSDSVQKNFDLATALLHSFEYSEAEKTFAKVIAQDPDCLMAYWGVAMCNFHPLWEPPSQANLKKGSRVIALARSVGGDKSSKAHDYLEAIATIYDQWDSLDHATRVLKFEKASAALYEKYPADNEAAIFYALALRAAADPADKSFKKQKKAGEILEFLFQKEPNHPGIAHYIIHNYDYPELARLALPAARKYAAIASASAHAQHMPSHIFTRLGLWDEAIRSNKQSISSAQCYAENAQMKGHWDEELHGLDYLVYAYLQKGDDANARQQVEYLKTINDVFPQNFKDAYCFAAMPARYALERRDWKSASQLSLGPANFPWEKFKWERAHINFARLMGAIHLNDVETANGELKSLESIHQQLVDAKDNYKANLVNIQINIGKGWIKLAEGKSAEAIKLMNEAANMEDLTEKHPVTPGELLPARELLGDMYMAMKQPAKALEAYQSDLNRHPNRFNGMYGAGLAAEKLGHKKEAASYFDQLLALGDSERPGMADVEAFVKKHATQ